MSTNVWIVLLEAPFDPVRRQMNSVLLTVDLTNAVADEAIERNDSIVVAYRQLSHPLVSASLIDELIKTRSNHIPRTQKPDLAELTTAESASIGIGRNQRKFAH